MMSETMSTLNTQYETLLRRGMPEHPRLWYDASIEADSWYSTPPGAPVDESDARAIITMQAMEWFLALARADNKCHEYIELLTWTTYSGCTTLTCSYEGWKPEHGPIAYEATVDGDWNILAAIIAATEHLEKSSNQ